MLHQVLTTSLEHKKTGADWPIVACSELYRQLLPIHESAEVIRLAIALHPHDDGPGYLDLLDTLEHTFEPLSGPSAALAARATLHLALSLIEEEQTHSLLAGTHPPIEPPAHYIATLEHLIRGFSTTPQTNPRTTNTPYDESTQK